MRFKTPIFDLKLRFILKPRLRPIPMPIQMPKMGPRPTLDLGARLKLRSTRTLELTPSLGIWTCFIWPTLDWLRLRLVICLRFRPRLRYAYA